MTATTTQTIVTCACGQQNRLPITPVLAGFVVICGRCKAPLDSDDDDADADMDDDLEDDDEDGAL